MGLFDALAAPLVAEQQATNDAWLQSNQYEMSKEFWNMQNEYNTPSAQMQRLKDAGVNPATTMMNGGSVQTGNASAPPQLPAPVSHDYASAVAQMLSGLGNNRLLNAQAKTEDLLRNEKYENMKAQTGQYLANIEKLGVDTRGQQIANQYASALNEVSLMKSWSDIGINFRQMAFMEKEVKKMAYELEQVLPQQVRESISREKLNYLEQDKVVAEIERVFYQNAESEQNIAESKTRQGLLQEQVESEQEYQNQMQAETKYVEKSTEELDNQIKLFLDTYDDQITKIANDAKISKKQAQWYVVNQIVSDASSVAFGVGVGLYGGMRTFGKRPRVGF